MIVTGATGGVGSIAVQLLAARGYQVTALTGKDAEHDFSGRSAPATSSAPRLQMGTKPLEKPLWAGAVDVVGGETLAWLTRTMMYGGCIASSGLTGGTDLQTTVLPFILRGVKLLGIDSVMCPAAEAAGGLAPSRDRPEAGRTPDDDHRDRPGRTARRRFDPSRRQSAWTIRGEACMTFISRRDLLKRGGRRRRALRVESP